MVTSLDGINVVIKKTYETNYTCTPLDYLENSLSSRVESSATFKRLCGLPILIT